MSGPDKKEAVEEEGKSMTETTSALMRHQSTYDVTASGKEAQRINVGQMERVLCTAGGGALALYALNRLSKWHLGLALAGGALVYRGLTGHCPVYQATDFTTVNPSQDAGLHLQKTITVYKPRDEVYQSWRHLENLPRVMPHLDSVQRLDNRRSHWVATGPFGINLVWDAELTEERPPEFMAWRSLPGTNPGHEGMVRFRQALDGRGTEIQVRMTYHPPGGVAGAALARVLKTVAVHNLQEDLRRFKQMLEAGEVATGANQTYQRA
jgi:uncharacterized membrane protein